ncbi:MAG: response regulator [Promethearchaeota archaeon]
MSGKVLVVDDAAFMRQLVRNILISNGFEVCGEASNGKEAIEKYFELFPDLVLSDIVMPKMNGLDALKEIIKKDSSAKIIMLSALDEQETVINALHLGAKDFLVKPINKKHFLRTVRRVLSTKIKKSEKQILLQIYLEIFDDLDNYIEKVLSNEIMSQISSILQSLETKYPDSFYYDENINQIVLKPENTLSFEELNEILIQLVGTAKLKVEQYIPYAKNVFTETFRFVYLRNKSTILDMQNKIKYPKWLEKEINFVDTVMNYLFKS